MKAVICQNATLRVDTLPAPKPAKGQVLLNVLRCGICGSDLHMRQHCDHMRTLTRRVGYDRVAGADDALVFGHEFCGEIADYGPGTQRKLKAGTAVCAVPLIRNGEHVDALGLSAHAPGAYAEQVLVQEALMVPIPNGLAPDRAALTEPMAVALHAVRRSEIRKGEVAIVIGCGPVGLAVICILKAMGMKAIVASDFSPGRRALARRCGADVVIDPRESSPYQDGARYGFVGSLPQMLELGVGTREKLGKLPVPWWHSWRLAEALGLQPKRPVIFECVGVPGILQTILDGAPLTSRVIVVGVCMQADQIEPSMAINKEIELRFVLGYTPLEYRDALHLLAEGKVNGDPLVTGTVGLEGVDGAFSALGDAERHAKILIDPRRQGIAIAAA
ncbi:MAG: alcohol dehydrogenase [Nevskiaceae bacterium]|nr:MAG: alcohol dehydrogenase [Nevskiaceae bacterium]